MIPLVDGDGSVRTFVLTAEQAFAYSVRTLRTDVLAMVNLIPTIIFDVLLAGAAVALLGATIRSMLPRRRGLRRGGLRRKGAAGVALWQPRRRSVRGELRPALGRVVPLATRRQELARRAS